MSAASAAAIRTPRLKENRLAATESVEDLSRVLGRLHSAKDVLHRAVRVDDDGRALDAHVLLAREALLDPEAVRLGDLMAGIGQEREWQTCFCLNFACDSSPSGLTPNTSAPVSPERVPGVADPTSLLGAAGRVVLG